MKKFYSFKLLMSALSFLSKKISATDFKNPRALGNLLVSYIIVLEIRSAIELLRFHYRTAVSKPTS